MSLYDCVSGLDIGGGPRWRRVIYHPNDGAQRLECPVCLEVQDGPQHQCREGHVFCASCDTSLRAPRRCPECRMALGPLSQAIRSRSHEERIAALPAACSHCGLATTRGEVAAHEQGCPHALARENNCMWLRQWVRCMLRARDWLANELYEPSRGGKIDAACRDRKVADLITAAGASAPADAVFGGRFATGETPRSTTSASEADEGDGAGGDGGTGFDLFGPDPTPMEDL